MRIRRRKNATDILLRDYQEFVVEHPETWQGKWKSVLNKEMLYAEFGAGKGRFITNKALQNPGILFVGVEREPEVLIKTAQKALETMPPNLRLIHTDVADLEMVFAPGEVDRIFLNFSDPWPKRRHAARRLTSPGFLAKYETMLAKKGEIHFKTDNQKLFLFSVKSFKTSGWTLLEEDHDYHIAPDSSDIMTEYEERFRLLGQPIYRLVAVKSRA